MCGSSCVNNIYFCIQVYIFYVKLAIYVEGGKTTTTKKENKTFLYDNTLPICMKKDYIMP